MSDLQILFPEPEVIPFRRSTVEIRPVGLADFELYGKTAGAMIELLSAGTAEQIHSYAVRHTKDLAHIIVATTSLSAWRARRLPAVVSVQLMVEIIRVNSGFFGKAQVAMAKALTGL